MKFPNRLKEILEERGLKQADLCRMTGFSTAKVSKYITGQSTPVLDAAITIADALGVTLDDLAGRTVEQKMSQETTDYSADEKEMIRKFRVLNEHTKRTVRQVINIEYENAIADFGEESRNAT